MLTLILLVTGFTVLGATPAQAATGSFDAASITVDNDGVSAVPGDTSRTDGIVAIRNSVVFSWRTEFTSLTDGVMTQTLPPLWKWDAASLDKSGLNSTGVTGGYRSSYVLSEDGRTVTATVSATEDAGGTVSVSFPNLIAVVPETADVPGSNTYVPTLTVTDGAGERTADIAGPVTELTVVSQQRADLLTVQWQLGPNGQETTFDFGDGLEPAIRRYSEVRLTQPNAAGDRPYLWADNVRVRVDVNLMHHGEPYTGPLGLKQSNATNAAQGKATLENASSDNRSFELNYYSDGRDIGYYLTVVDYFVPLRLADDLEIAGGEQIHLKGTVSYVTPPTTVEGNTLINVKPNGEPLAVDFAYVRGIETQPASVLGRVAYRNNIGSTIADWNTSVLPGFAGGDLGVTFRPKATHPRNTTEPWTAVPTTNTNLYAYTKTGEYELDLDNSSIQLGQGRGGKWFTEGTDYRIYYTTDAVDTSVVPGQNPETMNWIERSEYTGDLKDVTGVRAEYLANGGTWDPAPEKNVVDLNMVLRIPVKVTRPLPVRTDLTDRGMAYMQGWVTGANTEPLALSERHWLIVRQAILDLVTRVNALDAAGVPADPARNNILAGETVRYTVTASTRVLPANATEDQKILKNVEFEMCFPANAVDYSLTPLDQELWNVEYSAEPCGAAPKYSTGKLILTPKFDVRVDKPIPAFQVDVVTDVFPPATNNGSFEGFASVHSDGVGTVTSQWGWGGVTNAASAVAFAAAPTVALYSVNRKAPEVAPGVNPEFTLTWGNYQPGPDGKAAFVSVLPYNGDAASTSISGPLTLASASLKAPANTGSKLQLTIDPAIREGNNGAAPADSVTWIDYASATPEQLAAATGLRFTADKLPVGASGVGSMTFTLNAPESKNGDTVLASASGIVNEGVTGSQVILAAGKAARVDVIDTSIRGTIWHDLDGNGSFGDEPGLGGVSVALLHEDKSPVLAEDGTPVTVATDEDGSYYFGSIAEGNYRVAVDTSTLSADQTWTYTSGTGDPVSDPVTLAKGDDSVGTDFGFRALPASLTLTKSGVAPATVAAGENLPFTFVVTNTGETALTGVAITDALPGVGAITVATWPNPATPGVLPAGTSITATANYALTQADVDAGGVTNNALVNGTSPTGNVVRAEASTTVPLSGVAGLGLTLTGTVASEPVAVGDTVTFTYLLANTGNTTLTDVAPASKLTGQSDFVPGLWPSAAGTLAPGQTVSFTTTIVVTQAMLDAGKVVNPGTGAATDPAGTPVNADATVTVPLVAASALDVQASAAIPSGVAAAGESVEYTLTVTNSGSAQLENVRLDPNGPWAGKDFTVVWPDPTKPGVLGVGESAKIVITDTLTQAQVDAGLVSADDLVVEGTDPSATTVIGTGTASLVLSPAVAVSLTATGEIIGEPVAGSRAEYSMLITNTGATTLSGTELTSSLAGLGEITFGPILTRAAVPGALAPGASVTARAGIDLTQAHVDAGKIVNPLSVTGTAPSGATATDTDEVVLELVGAPGITLTKTATLEGDQIRYAFTITNTGAVTLAGAAITDALPGLGAITYVWPAEAGVLAPGATATAQATLTVTDALRGTAVINQASVTATAPNGDPVTATDTVSVDVPAAPGITDPGGLALTGAGLVWPILIALILLILAGAGLLIWKRRRDRDREVTE
ncbi:putative repeat protein (TIGR01451 family) [Mycetocola sp. BIGb0189]|uniref:DUF7507 domain-containing protein n=1 Tax=Mycetocola sp. BIGb0189 TaxID=2940604 RepID=UPI002168BF48|nr:SdrD B-like domain-containing protein [Mycetocola sp. BIGb0189]MCS4277652.1 putative repeat protein (TIGR01451 family) [Mycetocola sp. BIGb0189]